MRKLNKIVIFAASLLLISSFFQVDPASADGPYRGKVIDAETKAPIEGAVVLGVWRRRELFSFHPKYLFDEAKEVLTNSDGEFVLQGHTRARSIIDPMSPNRIRIYIYKPGYGSFPRHQISPNPKQSHSAKLKPFETHVLVELPKLRTRDQKLGVVNEGCPAGDIPNAKMANLIIAMNIDRVALGFQPTECFKGKIE